MKIKSSLANGSGRNWCGGASFGACCERLWRGQADEEEEEEAAAAAATTAAAESL